MKTPPCGFDKSRGPDPIKRLIGIDLDELRRVKTRMFVANGNRKLDAVRAVLNGKYATHLVIDEASGKELSQS